MKRSVFLLGLLAGALVLHGCKGGAEVSTPVAITGHLGGAGISGATVTMGSFSTTSDSNGDYSLSIPEGAFTSEMVISSTGGSYVDEVSGQTVTLDAATGLSAYVPANSLSAMATEVNLNAGTTVVYLGALKAVEYHAAHGHTHTLEDTYGDVSGYFNTAFGYSPDFTTKAVSAAATPASTDSDAQKLAGLREAAFSQLAKDLLGSADSKMDLLMALGSDLGDGALDGMGETSALSVGNTSLPATLQNKWETSLVTYLTGSSNKSALTADKIGALPFAKKATTSNYIVTYTAGTMAAAQGLTTFELAVTDLSGNAVSGALISLTPMMYMASMTHASPQDGCTLKSGSTNTFTCKVYYLMAGGAGMGYWKLSAKVTKNGANETAVFYPAVGMAMSDTARVTLRSTVLESAASTKRYYYVFKDSVSTGSFGVFLATQESMMSFPTLKTGTTYNAGGAYALTPSTITVEYSKDKTTWTAMTSASNDGHYTASGLGLTAGTATSLYVRVKLDGDGSVYATSDGTTSGTAYGTFTVTPSSSM